MLRLSPVRWLPAKSPASATLTLMSLIWWTEPKGPPLVTRTRCVSALPYWLGPSRIVMGSRSFISAVAERAQQQRDVVVLAGVRDGEHHGDLRVELGDTLLLEVVGGVEFQPVLTEGDPAFGQLTDASVGARGAAADDRPPPVCPAVAQSDRHSFCGSASRGIEHVGRNAHELSMLLRRSRVILACSSAATLSSVAGSFSIRWRRAVSTSSALRPAAEIRKTWPKRSSYRRFPSASTARVSSLALMTPFCSRLDEAGERPPRSPIRGWAVNASSQSDGASWAHTLSAACITAATLAYGRPAATPKAHARDPQQASRRRSASPRDRRLNDARVSLNPERHQLEANDVDEAAVGDLQLGDDREGEEAQRHEGRGHRHAQSPKPLLHRGQTGVHARQRLVAHQAGDRQRELLHHAPTFSDDDAASDVGQAARAGGHVRVVDADDDDVMRVVSDSRCVGSTLQPDVGGEAEADSTGGVMPLEHRDLGEVSGRVGDDRAISDRRLDHLGPGQELRGDDADDSNPLGAGGHAKRC